MNPPSAVPASIEIGAVDGTGRDRSPRFDVVVVIDVIRAFTTACLLFDHGATELLLARSMRDLRSLSVADLFVADLDRETAVPAMSDGRKILPNSPASLRGLHVGGKTVAMHTENGTRALLDAPSCDLLLAAATVNLSATAERIRASGCSSVLLLASDPRSHEDLACARHLAGSLAGRALDTSGLAMEVWAGAESHRRRWEHLVSRTAWRNFEADVRVCAGVDTLPIALEASDSTGRMRLRAAAPRHAR